MARNCASESSDCARGAIGKKHAVKRKQDVTTHLTALSG